LIEAATGNHLWGERYDRDVQDIFDVQDDVVQAIVAILPGVIEGAGARSARRKRPENLAAYDYLLRGIELDRTFDDADTEAARQMFERAIAVDATIAPAYAWLATLRLRDWWIGRSGPSLDDALALAKKAVATDGNDGFNHGVLGMVHLERRNFDEATFHIERFLALNPNDAGAAVLMGDLLAYVGRAQEGVAWMERAFRLNPLAPQAYNSFYGMILFVARRYAESIAVFSRIVVAPEAGWEFIYLVADHAYLGRIEEARALIDKWTALRPGSPLLAFAAKEPFKHPADLDHLLDGLRKAGLTE
jgi:adenylate cyclase